MKAGTGIQRRESSDNGGYGKNIVAAALKAQLVTIISGFVLMLCFCGVAYSLEDPDSVTKPLSLCALLLSALCGGFSAARRSGESFLPGLCSGAGTVALIFLFSLFSTVESGLERKEILTLYLCVVGCALCGSVIGKRRKSFSQKNIRARRNRKR